MPFVKRQRTYYKDGVEVPANTITDFGRTVYYKNIVTTKYWKEVTTGSKELEYACYKGDVIGSTSYYYVKAPIGSDFKVYANTADNSQVDSIDKLAPRGFNFSSIADEKVTAAGYTLTRYRDGDLYIDTTVTETVEGTPEDYTYTTEEVVPVEVTADDEYDYTEFIPSTQFDTYTDTDKLYQLATKKRTYYKYEYQDWTQPVATAATTAITGGNMVITASSTEPYRKIYGALDGSMSAAENAWLSNSSGAAWWQVKFPYKIKITGLTHYNPYVNASCAITSAQFFTSSSKTTPIGNSFSTPNTDWYKTVISGIPSEGIVTDTIYFSGVGGGYAGIGELVITAQKQLPAVESTSADYDYYTDKLLSYEPINVSNYYKFTINPTPADATVTINGQNINTVKLIKNSRIVWSVSADGYAEQSGTVTLSEDTIMNVVLEERAYVTDQVIFESSTAGTYEVELLENGNYEVYCIGGGAGGAYSRSTTTNAKAGGGSGSGFIGVVLLSKGDYSITVGAGGAGAAAKDAAIYSSAGGNSLIENNVVAYGGGAAYARVSKSDTHGGAGGKIPDITVETVSTTLNKAGNKGGSVANDQSSTRYYGGASVYNGYGKGGDAFSINLGAGSEGTAGYVKIVWKG